MKFAWCNKIEDFAGNNSVQVEEVDLEIEEYTEILEVDDSAAEFDRLEDEFIMLE